MGFFENMENNMAEEVSAKQETTDNQEMEKEEAKVIKPFQIWEVGGQAYRLKLRTSEICELEQRYKTNLINVMEADGMPALTDMLIITHSAMQKYHHGIKLKDVEELFERYIEEGGSQLAFYSSVYMGIFKVSGFFSGSVSERLTDMMDAMEERLR